MPTLTELRVEKAVKIARAAISFARDHGPIAAASEGDGDAAAVVHDRLVEALSREGLIIVKGNS